MPQEFDSKCAQPKIGIVITDFNGWDQTRHCLKALRDSRYKDFEVILVDHGTTNRTREGVLREAQATIWIPGNKALWWTGATNLGIRTALERQTPYIMLLNNDCMVKPDTIGRLMDHAHTAGCAVIAPVQRDIASGEYSSITPRDLLLLGFTTWPGGPKTVTPEMRAQRILPTRLISGGRGVLIPQCVFGKVGLLDEQSLPHYGADHDFYFRCRSAGVPLRVAVDAEVLIDNTRTSSASRMETLTWEEFLHSFRDIRSHRNTTHLRALFRKHYPIPPLYFIGLWLANLRYFSVYLIKRMRKLAGLSAQ